jgi:hypothetical protein
MAIRPLSASFEAATALFLAVSLLRCQLEVDTDVSNDFSPFLNCLIKMILNIRNYLPTRFNLHVCNETNLMPSTCISSVYSITTRLHVSGLLVAHHQ